MFQIKINGAQEAISRPLEKPDEYSPIYVYAANVEHNENGKDYGKASISDLILVPKAKGFIFDEISEIIDPTNGLDNNTGIAVTSNNFLKEINSWGPAFEITFELKVKKFSGQVLYLTDGTRAGDGIPQVIAVKNRLEVSTKVNGEILKLLTKILNINVWYHITISQKQSSSNIKKVVKFFCIQQNIEIFS